MESQHQLRDAFERKVDILGRRSSAGVGTSVTRVTVIAGLQCAITSGKWTFQSDMGITDGGLGEAPTPGDYLRCALGTDLATSYMLWSSRMEIQIDALSVSVEVDYDKRGAFGIGDASPEYIRLRYRVTVQSPHSQTELLDMMDVAEQHCPNLQLLKNAPKIDRIVRIDTAPAGQSEEEQ